MEIKPITLKMGACCDSLNVPYALIINMTYFGDLFKCSISIIFECPLPGNLPSEQNINPFASSLSEYVSTANAAMKCNVLYCSSLGIVAFKTRPYNSNSSVPLMMEFCLMY